MREYEDFTFFSESVARTMGFHTTAHAGEAAGADSMLEVSTVRTRWGQVSIFDLS